MKQINIKNYKGMEFKGMWNEKFYASQADDKTLIRIYVNNQAVHITQEQKEELIKSISGDKIHQDNCRLGVIKSEFTKLDYDAQVALINYLIDTTIDCKLREAYYNKLENIK